MQVRYSGKRLLRLVFFLAVALLALPQASWGGLSLGLGAAIGQSPYRGVSSEFLPLPVVSYRSRWFYVQGLEAGANVWGKRASWGQLQASLLLKGRLQGYDSSDSVYLQSMASRENSLDAGLGVSGRLGSHQFALQWLHDLLDRHQGQEASLSYQYALALTSRLTLSPGVGLSWQSSDLLGYYYGVTPAEARVKRAAYMPDAGWEPRLSLGGRYQLSEKSGLLLRARVHRLASSVDTSPLVDKTYLSSIFMAWIYRF